MSENSESNARKRRIHEIDAIIENLSQDVTKLNDFVYKSELECSLMTARLKREKVKALTAIAKSQVILADMDILIAESDLYTDLERMKNMKKFKSDLYAGRSQQNITTTQEDTAATRQSKTRKTMLDQATQTMFDRKHKKKSSSSKTKPPVDPASEDTVLVETIDTNKSEFSIDSPQFNFNLGLLNKPNATSTSDSEASLSSSIKAEFNNPYTNTETKKPESKTHKKTDKSDKKIDSKSKSSTLKQRTQSPSITTRTVNEINNSFFSTKLHNTVSTIKNTESTAKNTSSTPKHTASTLKNIENTTKITPSTPKHIETTAKNIESAPKNIASTNKITVSTPKTSRQKNRSEPYNRDRMSTACSSTYIPIRHKLPPIIGPPKNLHIPLTTTSIMNPCVYVNTDTQSNMHEPPNSGINNQYFTFYGSQGSK